MKCFGIVKSPIQTQMQLRQLQCLVSSAAASVERALLWAGDASSNPEYETVALLEPVESNQPRGN